ncbi:hypothetical protein HanLR1_Chr01g0030481 [Helianthus annuus]|nr:hypothetical protein HanLR1_Chr01g0030481 [Helianthus annuus]
MHAKINFFNGLYQQADRTRASGCQDLDVMKVALKEFKERFPNGFQHIEAWEVVRKHEKWAQVPLMGEEGEGSAHKRKPVDVDFSIPDINEDPSPQRAQRRDKRQATSSDGRWKLGRVGGTIQSVHRHERSEASGRIGGDRIEEKKRVGGSRAHIGTNRDDEKLQLRSRYENLP